MKKLNLIIGKRQIMISTLLLILAIAAYLNWIAAGEQPVSVIDLTTKKTENSNSSDDSESTYGEAELVSTQTTNNYFDKAKNQRAIERLNVMDDLNARINSNEISKEEQDKARNKAELFEHKNSVETSIEQQVCTQFEDCVTTFNPETKTVQIAVKTENMEPQQANQIKDIAKQTDNTIPTTNIAVIPVR